MGFRDANRAQALQVGAILIFGIIILLLSVYQATVIPQQNARVEFNAYQEATSDLLSVRNDVLTAAASDTTAGTTVRTGATYPPRTIFVNPGTPTGSLALRDRENVSLAGVRAVENNPENVKRFWNETNGRYETRQLSFRPAYNEFDAPPMVLTGSEVYRTPNSALVHLSNGLFVQSNRITLVTLRGDLATAGVSTSVTAEPVSAATRTVVITGSEPTFNITVPTPNDATEWNETVAPKLVDNPNVITTTPHANQTATVTFNGSRQYELRLAAVELRARSSSSVVDAPAPSYVVPVTANGTTVTRQPTPVTVEVRDRYNNPVTGTEVNLTLVNGLGQFVGGGTSRTVSTDEQGRATVALRPAANYNGNLTVRAQGDFDGSGSIDPVERTDVGLSTPDGDASVNEDTGGISLGTSAVGGSGQNSDLVEITFNNTADADRTITDARVAFYYLSETGSGGGNNPSPSEWTFENPSRSTVYTIGAPRQSVSPPITLPANQETTITLDFSNPDPDAQNDFFILTVQFEEAGRGTYYIYVDA